MKKKWGSILGGGLDLLEPFWPEIQALLFPGGAAADLETLASYMEAASQSAGVQLAVRRVERRSYFRSKQHNPPAIQRDRGATPDSEFLPMSQPLAFYGFRGGCCAGILRKGNDPYNCSFVKLSLHAWFRRWQYFASEEYLCISLQ